MRYSLLLHSPLYFCCHYHLLLILSLPCFDMLSNYPFYVCLCSLPRYFHTVCQCRRHETPVGSLGWEDPLEEGMATHSSIIACRTPWIDEPDGLWSTGSRRVRHDWSDPAHLQHYPFFILTILFFKSGKWLFLTIFLVQFPNQWKLSWN